MTELNANMFDSYDFNSIQSTSWDLPFDQQMVVNYGQMLHSPDFRAGVDSSSVASPFSTASSPRSSSLSSSKSMSESRNVVPNKFEKRREQNRQSQRAYRDRKEKHQRELEAQVALWKQKHEILSTSYAAQADEILKLKALIHDLSNQLTASRSIHTDTWSSIDDSESLQEFDMFLLSGLTSNSSQ